ncbi:MAG: cysteine--tRNA ligase [Pseudomonadota bacterium]|nr:cysteine--tRNA ligase [Pseudomonadota bacterium]
MQIYDSLAGEKRPFVPLVEGQVGIYVCGMTVYDYCHIGHARVMVAFDVIVRYLRALGYRVTYVRNITDVDDKIFQRANERGIPFSALTAEFIDAMHQDEASLGLVPPDLEPAATRHMPDIIRMVARLLERGYAYQANHGDVYFRVRQFAPYGRLSNRNLDDLQAGARVAVDDAKEDPLDFVLWKAAKPGEASWESPWGPGRPGWHIECSAMSMSALGETIDIHGGGPDLKFPHHENEIAQSEAATGKPFASYWMHAGAVRVDGEKMSKSLGNFFTIRDVLKHHDAETIRYFLVSSHYRSPIQYSTSALGAARQALERLYTTLRDSPPESGEGSGRQQAAPFVERFHRAMADDFNTPEALAVLFELAREVNRDKGSAEARRLSHQLRILAQLLGLLQADPERFLQSDPDIDDHEVRSLIEARALARSQKNWARADAIRDELKARGVVLDDGRHGTTWHRAR